MIVFKSVRVAASPMGTMLTARPCSFVRFAPEHKAMNVYIKIVTAEGGYLLTEAGAYITTEAGDKLVWE